MLKAQFAMPTVLVTGGSGTLGHTVLARLAARQYRAHVLVHETNTPLSGEMEMISGDLASGHGLAEAVAGVHAIIHCASAYRDGGRTDVEGTRLLLQAARADGAPHLIYPSIVGVERSTYAYYQTKRATERLIEQGPLPWTIVRTTQFHDFVLRLIQSFGADTQPVVAVPGGMRFQSIAVDEVADRLVSLVAQGPATYASPMGGPKVRTIEEMTEAYLHIAGSSASVRREAVIAGLFEVFTTGINLVPDHAVGTITWEAFLHWQHSQQ
jgi:uncharacterized protein YbjT (DUF2867 family)